MGTETSSTRSILSTAKDRRVLMCGLDGAGKTTMLYRIKLGNSVTSIPNIGFQVETVSYKNICFTVFDAGGQDKIRPLWRHYFQNTDGLVWVMDSNDRNRFIESRKELHLLMFNEPELQQNIPLLIYANKMDIDDCMTVDEIFSKLFDFNSTKYSLNVTKKRYLFDDYLQIISQILIKTYEKDNDVDLSKEICQLVVDYIPCQGMLGKIDERDFCILATSGSVRNNSEIGLDIILRGLDWLESTLRSEKGCILM